MVRETPARRRRAGYRARSGSRFLRLADPVTSGALQIGFPGIDRNLQAGIGCLAPQLAAVERRGVEPLRIFASTSGVAVGKDMTAQHAFDDADMPAHIARQPRMGRRMDHLGADAIAYGEQSRAEEHTSELQSRQYLVCRLLLEKK